MGRIVEVVPMATEAAGASNTQVAPLAGRDNDKRRTSNFLRRAQCTQRVDQMKKFEEDIQKEQEKRVRGVSSRLHRALEILSHSSTYSLVTLAMVIISVFGDDLGVLFLSKEQDIVVDILLLIALGLFILDIIVMASTKNNYLKSSFFLLDVVSTLSIIPDISLLGFIFSSLVDQDGKSASTSVSRIAAGATRAGSRASRSLRLMRVFRVMRLLRLFKVFKLYEMRKQTAALKEQGHAGPKRTFGRNIADSSLQKVMIAILAVLLIFPLLESPFENSSPFETYGLRQLHFMAQQPEGRNSSAYQLQLTEYGLYDAVSSPLIELVVSGHIEIENKEKLDELRDTSKVTFSFDDEHGSSRAVFDISRVVRDKAILSISKTLVLLVILVILSIFFSRQIRREVTVPIEKLLNTVSTLSLAMLQNDSEPNRGQYRLRRQMSSRHAKSAPRNISDLLAKKFRRQSIVLSETLQSFENVLKRTDQYLRAVVPTSILERLHKGEGILLDEYTKVAVLTVEIADFQKAIVHLGLPALLKVTQKFHEKVQSLAESLPSVYVGSVDGPNRFVILCGCPDFVPNTAKRLLDMAERLMEKSAALDKRRIASRTSRRNRGSQTSDNASENKEEEEELLVQLACAIDVGTVYAGIFSKVARFVQHGEPIERSKLICKHARAGELLLTDEARLVLRDWCKTDRTDSILDFGSLRLATGHPMATRISQRGIQPSGAILPAKPAKLPALQLSNIAEASPDTMVAPEDAIAVHTARQITVHRVLFD